MSSTESLQTGFEITKTIIMHFRNPLFLSEAYPALFNQGVSEGSIHSFMLSSLTLLGDHLGYSAVCDSPVFDELSHLLIGEGYKRPDSVWFTRGTDQIRLLIEFEKYKPGSLEAKIKNLLIMSKKALEALNSLILFYWSDTVRSQSDLENCVSLAKTGFSINRTTFRAPNCPIAIIEVLVTKLSGGRLAINSISARALLYNGENKLYLVERINGD